MSLCQPCQPSSRLTLCTVIERKPGPGASQQTWDSKIFGSQEGFPHISHMCHGNCGSVLWHILNCTTFSPWSLPDVCFLAGCYWSETRRPTRSIGRIITASSKRLTPAIRTILLLILYFNIASLLYVVLLPEICLVVEARAGSYWSKTT